MYCKITTTTDSKLIAEKISKKIINLKYSPCIQINNGITSVYTWEKKINKISEYKIDIKTIDKYSKDIINIIKSIHNYEIPEIIKSKIDLENKDYEEWFLKNLNG